MTDEEIPAWAKDENDPPATLWERKDHKKEDPVKKSGETDKTEEPETAIAEEEESEETVEETEDESEDTEEEIEDDETEESEEDDDEESEDEGDDEEEENESEDEESVSPDNATLDDLAAKEDEKTPENEENKTPLNSEKGTETPTDPEKPPKSRSRRSFKYSTPHPMKRLIYWFNGSEEHPLPVFSLRAKFKRWMLIKFHNHVWLRIMSYDKNKNEYAIYENLIPRKKLPKTAVHCSNEKNVYFDKLFDVPYEPWKDNGFGAMNAYLYMKDTSIDEALLLLWQGPKVNMKTLGIIAIVIVAVMFYIFYMMQ